MKSSQKIKFIGSAVISGICVLFFLASFICFAAGVFSLPKGNTDLPDAPVVIPPDKPKEPEEPEPEDEVFGEYTANLYTYGEVQINLTKELSYSIENDDGVLFEGLFEIVSPTRVLLIEEDGFSIDLTLSRPAYTAALTDITSGKTLLSSYTRQSVSGASTDLYTLKLYMDGVFALLISENGGANSPAVYGHYFYNTDNVFVIRYLNLSEKLVLRTDGTFIPSGEEIKSRLSGSYTFASSDSESNMEVVYELQITGGSSYNVFKRYYQNSALLPKLTETAHGIYTVEDDKLIIPYFKNARILLNLNDKNDDEDNTFSVIYNLHYGFDDKATGRRESYSLVLTLTHNLDYDFVLTDLLNLGGALIRYTASGTVGASALNGFSIWTAQTFTGGTDNSLAIWTDIESDNPGFIFVNKLTYGRYRGLVNAVASELEINSNGTYKIRQANAVISSGNYSVAGGFFGLGGLGYAKLYYDYTFTFEAEPVVEYEISLKSAFAVGETIDFEDAYISFKTVHSRDGGTLNASNFSRLSTAAAGSFTATVTYGSFVFEMPYTVIDSEEDSPAYLVVEGLPAVVEQGALPQDVIASAYYYTVSKLGVRSGASPLLQTMIRKFSSAATGAFRMILNAETFLFYHDYTVVPSGNTIVSISVIRIKQEYDKDETPDYTGAVLDTVNALGIHKEENLKELIENNQASCNLSTGAAGGFIAEIAYNDLRCYFSYTVKEPIPMEDAVEIALDNPITLYEATNESEFTYAIKLSFTADETGEYVFSGTSEFNTQAHLYDDLGEQIAYNDNDPDDPGTIDFKIKVTLQAGVTYILTPSFVSTKLATIRVTVTKV